MAPTNQQILDDVAAIRERVAFPEDRDYTLMARGDHIRVKFDDDSHLVGPAPFAELDELGYRMDGANLSDKTDGDTLVFVRRDGDDD